MKNNRAKAFHLNTLMKCASHIILLSSLSVSMLAQAANKLEPMYSEEFDEVLIAPTIKVSTKRKLFVAEVPVTFSEDWLDEFESSTSKSYRRHIERKYGSTLKKGIEKALKEEGWSIAKKPSNSTIVIKPALSELKIVAPEQTGNQETILARNAGSAKVQISFSAPDGDALMQITDAGNTPPAIGSPFANRRTNYIYFKLLLNNWADLSAAYLDSLIDQVELQAQK